MSLRLIELPLLPTRVTLEELLKNNPLKGPTPAAWADVEVETDTDTTANVETTGAWLRLEKEVISLISCWSLSHLPQSHIKTLPEE